MSDASSETGAPPASAGWTPSVPVGVAMLIVLAGYFAFVLTSGPTEGARPIAGTVFLGVWIGTLALVHLTRRAAPWMMLPGVAALLATATWLSLIVPAMIADPGSIARNAPLAVVLLLPAAVPLLFGVAHVLAARGRPHTRVLVAAWVAVPVALLCAYGFLLIAIGASGMGGG